MNEKKKSEFIVSASTQVQLANLNKQLTLKDSTKIAIRNYLLNLKGQKTSDLYELILSEIEQPVLDMIMQYTRGNQTKAANMLGINRGTLRKKLKKYNLG